MICPRCHTDNRPNAKYCDACGCELPTVAPDAHEMFDGATTTVIGADRRCLDGIDQINDSSYAAEVTRISKVSDDPGRTYISAPPQPSAQAHVDISPSGRRKVYVALIVVLCLLAVALAAAGITYSAELWGGRAVPDIVGMDASEATRILADDGFTVERKLVKSDEVEGIVLACDPASGTRIPDGAQVTMEVSTPRLVPNVVGMSKDEAQSLFGDEGFSNVEYTEVKSNDPEGCVLKVSPDAGTRAKADAKISAEVAIPFRVPDVIGMTEQEARGVLEAEGYAVKAAYVYDESIDEGRAIGCDPAIGEALASGQEVTLNIAKHRGSELVNLTRSYLNDAKKVLLDGQSYEISEIRSISYSGNSTCAYTMVARPFETHSWFGIESETRYGNYETINGTITWDDNDSITASKPTIERI